MFSYGNLCSHFLSNQVEVRFLSLLFAFTGIGHNDRHAITSNNTHSLPNKINFLLYIKYTRSSFNITHHMYTYHY